MPAYRFYLDSPLQPNRTYPLPQEEHAHIKVLRLKEGDAIELVNGRGDLAQATLLRNQQIQITELTHTEPAATLILGLALLKENKLDLVVEKGTELGASAFWFFPAAKSEKQQLSESRIKRLKLLTISALKQSGRLYLPPIELKPSLPYWKELPYPTYFGAIDAAAFAPAKKDLLILIGPEAGLSTQEEHHLETLGATPMKLNTNTLRAETAAIAALAIAAQL